MRLLLLISFLLAAIPVLAQDPVPRCFKAYNEAGDEVTVFCVGELISFRDCSVSDGSPGVDADKEYFDYDKSDGLDFSGSAATAKQHRYTQPGTYTVTQLARDVKGIQVYFERTFEVKAIPKPAFTITACANRSVQVTISNTDYDLFDIDFGNGTIRRNVVTGEQPIFNYTGTAASYTITVTGKYAGSSCQNSIEQVIDLLPPATVPVISRLEVLSEAANGEISLNLLNLQPGYRYEVERLSPATGRYETVHTTPDITQNTLTNYRIPGLNTAEATQYRLLPVDRCGTNLSSAASVPVSSLALGVQPGEETATLAWRGNNQQVQRYEVSRNGAVVQTLARNVFTFTDRNLTCGQNYCYQVTGIENGGASSSVSAQRCVQIASSATPPAGYLYTTYDQNNQVQLAFTVPTGHEAQQIRYQRSIDGAPYANITTTPQTEFSDPLQVPGVCYRAVYTNPCNRESELSNTSCPVYLIVLPQENAPIVSLGWTGYVGFPDGIGQYAVEVLDGNNQVISSYPATGNTYIDRNLSDEVQELRYRIKVTSGNGSAVSYSNTVAVRQPLQVHIPNAFTPNNDGLNDVFEIKGRFIRDFRITVYNSMGQVVFNSTDRATSWDGTYQGKPQPAGAYAYEINIITTSGEQTRRTGTVTLMR